MTLSDAKARNAKPLSKPYKLTDGDGMFLLVKPNGGKYWRFRYFINGRERLTAFGKYPEVSLSDARLRRFEAQKVIAAGNDPAVVKTESKQLAILNAENDFESVAREWLAKRSHEWKSRTLKTKLNRLEMYVIPKMGRRPVSEIKAPEVLAMLRSIENRGILETTQRVKQYCQQIFAYAIATGRAERNPVPDLDGALKTPVTKHHAYLAEADLPAYLTKLEAYDGEPNTKLALRLLLLTLVRTLELRGAQWSEINLDKAEWRIPAERMKMKEEHIVPLSCQAVVVLRELKNHTGNRQYVFPNHHNMETYMSENAMLYALYRMGYHSRMTVHGFRSTGSTILNENDFKPDVIERQLAHCERNKSRAAYNRAQYLPERRAMMQWWADFIDQEAKKGESLKN